VNNEDKQQFAGMVSGYLKVMGRKVDQDVLEIWWRTLDRWGIDDVSKALQMAIEEGGNPIPATIIRNLPDPYGHPKPEDAWNAAQKDEYTEGAYMSQEMLNAVIAADDSIQRGDMIGARKCFLEVYADNVRESKRERRRPLFRYCPPIAQTHEQKQQVEAAATHEALARGWIGQEQANYALGRLEQLPQRVNGPGSLVQIGTIKQ